MKTEIELKLDVPSDHIDKLKRHPVIRAHRQGRAVTQDLHSVYFDTPDLSLHAQGASLRIRHQGRRRIQNVKLKGAAKGSHFARQEWEWDVAGDDLDVQALGESGLLDLLPDRDPGTLRPCFVSAFRRTAWTLAGTDDRGNPWRVELTLDRGEARTGDDTAARVNPICEIELELLDGRAEHLFGLAHQLAETIPLRLSPISKSERGYRLLGVGGAAPEKAAEPPLRDDMTAAEGLQAIIHDCLAQLLANEAALQESRPPEAIHQMRVALRRLRSAITLFRPLCGGAAAEVLRAEVKRITQELGDARDLDVFLAEILGPVRAALPQEQALDALAHEVEHRRDAGYARALDAVNAPEFTRMVLDVAAWAEGGDWLRPQTLDQRAALDRPLGEMAAEILTTRRKKVLKRGRHFATLAPAERHRVRIEIKKLRYAIDFFKPLYGKKEVRTFAKAMAGLQDELGRLNDVAVAHDLLYVLAASGEAPPPDGLDPRARAFAAGLVSGWHQAGVHDELDRAADTWKTFAEAEPFWR